MRISDSAFFTHMQRNLEARKSELDAAQAKAVSGLRVQKPSDDPTAFTEARQQTVSQARAKSHENAADAADSMLSVADSTLGDVDNALLQVRDLAVQGANDTLNADDRASLAQNVASLRSQLVALANAESGGHYIFGGYKDNAPPYDTAGVYSGDTSAQQVEIAHGVNVPTGITGDRVFGATGGQDVFAALDTLSAALTSGSATTISQSITTIDSALKQVRTARTEVGINLNGIDVARSVAQRNQDEAVQKHSKLVEVDSVDAYSDLARAQAALSAAVQIAAQLPPPGLAQRS